VRVDATLRRIQTSRIVPATNSSALDSTQDETIAMRTPTAIAKAAMHHPSPARTMRRCHLGNRAAFSRLSNSSPGSRATFHPAIGITMMNRTQPTATTPGQATAILYPDAFVKSQPAPYDPIAPPMGTVTRHDAAPPPRDPRAITLQTAVPPATPAASPTA